jgi:hypothetical protein
MSGSMILASVLGDSSPAISCRCLSPAVSVDAPLFVNPYLISTCGSCLGCTTMAIKIGGASGK